MQFSHYRTLNDTGGKFCIAYRKINIVVAMDKHFERRKQEKTIPNSVVRVAYTAHGTLA